MLKTLMEWVVDLFGFKKNSKYVSRYNREATIASGVYMSSVVVILEIWMILRYIKRYVFEAQEAADFATVMKYTRNFWFLLAVGIAVLVYALLCLRGKIKQNFVSDIVMIVFSGICVGFGMYVSHSDLASGKMLTCFLTMSLFVACLLIWKPYVSIIILTVLFTGYSYYLNHFTFADDGTQITLRSGDQVNYTTFLIALIMVAISIYHQRLRDAVKSEELERIAVEDDLTGAPNMHFFVQEAKRILSDETTDLSKKIVLFLNIENFKTYNDQLGYEKGNEFLKSGAEHLKEIFSDALYARQSDDHFVALVDIDKKDACIEKVKEDLLSRESEVYLSLKVGGYVPKKHDETPEICCDRARYACGLIKNQYGVTYREYDEKVDEDFHLSQYVVNHIDQAVEKGYIQVYYQPVVWSDNGELCGCEALARWIDPEYGFLSPGKFIPVLEDCKQIHKLDRCIFETVCRDMRNSMDKGEPVVPVSLNFSRLDFELMDAVQCLNDLVIKYDIPKDMLHVEVTESALTDNQQGLMNDLNRFHELGFALWLDDFGSGYSSLNVLKDYRFDVLKVDMVFLFNFHENAAARKILSCIIDLANRLGMRTLTEGVETEEAAVYLQQIGCGRLQGFLYGKPQPYSELKKRIADGEFTVTKDFEGDGLK